MDYKKLTIGKMAELNNISTQTLRYYDKIDILKPYIQDDENGYRYYSVKQSVILDIIAHLQSLNMSLDQIREYLQPNSSKDYLIRNLTDEYDKTVKEIERLESIRKILAKKIVEHQKISDIPKDGIPYIQVMPERQIFKFDTHMNYYYNGEYESTTELYEYMLRLFKKELINKGLGIEYFYNVGSIMKKADFINRHNVSTELFVMLEDDHAIKNYSTLEPNIYLCMICKDSSNEMDYIERLRKEIEDKGYEVVGDYVCEVIDEFFSYNSQARDYTLRIQVPISFTHA